MAGNDRCPDRLSLQLAQVTADLAVTIQPPHAERTLPGRPGKVHRSLFMMSRSFVTRFNPAFRRRISSACESTPFAHLPICRSGLSMRSTVNARPSHTARQTRLFRPGCRLQQSRLNRLRADSRGQPVSFRCFLQSCIWQDQIKLNTGVSKYRFSAGHARYRLPRKIRQPVHKISPTKQWRQ
jgi:hypothetical protein